jgi:hypothetical protein
MPTLPAWRIVISHSGGFGAIISYLVIVVLRSAESIHNCCERAFAFIGKTIAAKGIVITLCI